MISFKDNYFHIDTKNSSYVFCITRFNHLQNIYYGSKIPTDSYAAYEPKNFIQLGAQVAYDESDKLYCLDSLHLEYAATGKGDFRHPSMELKMPDSSFVFDFKYVSHSIENTALKIEGLPTAHGDAQTLAVLLRDAKLDVELTLYYTVFADCDVICRSQALKNNCENPLVIRKIMSLQLDLPASDYVLSTFDGSWIKERKRNDKVLVSGLYVNESITGNSSARHNPFVMLSQKNTQEDSGSCIAVNLIYSGNHYGAVDISPQNQLRIMTGINPHAFEWELKKGEAFFTPQGVLTYSAFGFNGVSENMHSFVNNHIIDTEWAHKLRPVLFNNWEATYFRFSYNKIVKLAKTAAALGVELFVLDDGWFGKRKNDRAGLGDWVENKSKVGRGGLKKLASKINSLNMKFGLWFEPEMVNPDSDLYRAHPEYAISVPDRTPSTGRNQLVLNLTKSEVCDYVYESVAKNLRSANIEYVKWDMNRDISDAFSHDGKGAFFHRYILGLYGILARLKRDFPRVLFESCASGGNRFDLGMLCYMPQTWTSDNTDAISRLDIQGGTGYGYSISTMGAHVANSPSHQTLRRVSLETRFNVAAFGVLGYEFDLTMLSRLEKNAIKKQIEFYKKHRELLQFGRFYRLGDYFDKNSAAWLVVNEDKTKAVLGLFERTVSPNCNNVALKTKYLDANKMYDVQARQQYIDVRSLGSLINHVSPVKLKGDGALLAIIGGIYGLKSETQQIQNASGAALNEGKVLLNQRFVGTGYREQIRLLGDYDSRLYVISASS